jgi:phospholipid/cholesterol/gamma-HCH transport system substrate-binding protein
MALLFLAVGVYLIGEKDFLFSPTYKLKADFQNVGGLSNGAEVRLGGIHQGTVKEIDLPQQPDGSVTVVMNMRSSTRNLIKKDSHASIKTEGLLGDKFVEISFGSDKAQDVADNDVIQSEKQEDLTQQARALGDEASQGIAAFRDDMDALQHNFLLRGFFKKRGYNDAAELTEDSASHVPAGKPTKEFDYDPEELFGKTERAELKNKKRLDEAGKYLEANPFGVAIIASSEAKGDSNKVHVLTEARAKAARDYLVQNFKLDDKRVKTIGLGKSKSGEDSSKFAILIYSATSTASAPSPAKSN